MTPRQIALIRQSWVKVQPFADEAARLFYERLFEARPEVRALFRGDLRDQGRKLMGTLAIVVHGLEKIDSLASLHDLGIRHLRYGARLEHFAAVREALLWTLEKGLGAAFDAEVKEAWLAMYDRMAARMQAAMAAA